MPQQDLIYSRQQEHITPFEFNDTVVSVFDDMITRSVPLYQESIQRQAQLAAHYYQPDSHIYDLGCSHGNFGIQFFQQMQQQPFHMVAIDNSQPMLDKYNSRLAALPANDRVKTQLASIEDYSFLPTSVAVINLTLQFLALEARNTLLQRIYDAMLPGGILLLSEKIIHAEAELAALQQDWYYRFKKENGYSQLEISQKRDALENVLIPETIEQHQHRLQQVGFKKIDVWLKWFNFTSILCIK
ncbi:MAG: carboxy-S-adenosyl-L-methionine synthase CmoA [Desulfobacteraceae bacterium 4572_35.1]|nr:MAG: carboxy-S-adenosyl-L-methionine synthase CmoA [Desulfobacteraceae bacterium 4572_35.1]